MAVELISRRVATRGARSISRPLRGQGLIEYLLIVALISIAAIVAVGALGMTVNGQWEYIKPFVGS